MEQKLMHWSDRGSGFPKWVFPKSDRPPTLGPIAPSFMKTWTKTSQFTQGVHSEAKYVRKWKSVEGISKTALGSNFSFNFPQKFLGQGWGIGFGTKLYALQRVSYGPGERIFGNALAFLRPFSFSPKFYPTLEEAAILKSNMADTKREFQVAQYLKMFATY